MLNKESLRIYIHWPFCISKCPYCDFNSHEINNYKYDNSKKFYKKWSEAYINELKIYSNLLKIRKIKSIYFGGGTPSLMDESIIYNILEYINKNSEFDNMIEITLEANPTSIENSKLLNFKNIGINRVSVGVQSIRNEHLKFLGRNHSVSNIFDALEIANNIFSERFSFDLIYGLPRQSLSEWRSDLENIFNLNLKNQHFSLYQLTIEKGTKFFSMFKNKKFIMPDENLQSDFYDLTRDIMLSKGFEAYEVSNYAKSESFYSNHNLGYWNYEDYLGIGPGAHSRISSNNKFSNHLKKNVYGFYNISKPENWLSKINENLNFFIDDNFSNINKQNYPLIYQDLEILKINDIISEIILMGLRKKSGIDLKYIKQKFNIDIISYLNLERIKDLFENKFLVFNPDSQTLFLTSSGAKLMDFIIKKILNNLNIS
jgi:putative oxygen-independent coproporphyrinogen III oxidase